jgi:hypothetical protein
LRCAHLAQNPLGGGVPPDDLARRLDRVGLPPDWTPRYVGDDLGRPPRRRAGA